MKNKVNAYLAVLFITVTGAAAALLIIHIAYVDPALVLGGGESQYGSLQQSILKP